MFILREAGLTDPNHGVAFGAMLSAGDSPVERKTNERKSAFDRIIRRLTRSFTVSFGVIRARSCHSPLAISLTRFLIIPKPIASTP